MQELVQFPYKKNLKNLHTIVLGRDYFYYNEIDSTQKEIWRRIDKNEIVNGCIIRAEKQTAGKGTHGRIWYTEENNIAFSLYVELQCNFSKIDGITTQIAEIIVSIIEQMYNIKLEIKLPNDIYINGKKLGGILTETKVKGGVAKFLVVGIGMNNAQLEFSNELNDIATSFKREFALEIDVEEFISSFCNIFESAILERIAR